MASMARSMLTGSAYQNGGSGVIAASRCARKPRAHARVIALRNGGSECVSKKWRKNISNVCSWQEINQAWRHRGVNGAWIWRYQYRHQWQAKNIALLRARRNARACAPCAPRPRAPLRSAIAHSAPHCCAPAHLLIARRASCSASRPVAKYQRSLGSAEKSKPIAKAKAHGSSIARALQ